MVKRAGRDPTTPFKSNEMLITIAAATAVLGAGVYAEPAHAGRTNCWFQHAQGGRLQGASCKVIDRKNVNGHVVHDVIEANGTRRAVVLWDNSTAEVFLRGERYMGSWQIDSDNDVRISFSAGVFAFRPTNFAVVRTDAPAPRRAAPAPAPQPAPSYQYTQQRQIIVQPNINVSPQIMQ